MHAVEMIRSRAAGLLLLGLVVTLTPAKTQALELGMTPSHVYGLWLNIHKVFLELQRIRFPGRVPVNELKMMTPNGFGGKAPEDVFARAGEVWPRLAETFGLGPLPPTAAWIEDYQALEGAQVEDKITPSEVFVLSSKILNALVDAYVEATRGKREVSSFYRENKATGKVPDDVFGLVDLMDRRLRRLRANDAPPGGGRP